MGLWDRIKKAAGNIWNKAAGAVGKLRQKVGQAWDTVTGWVQPWAARGTNAAYAAATAGMQTASSVVQAQFDKARREFERAQAAQNIRDTTARRTVRKQWTSSFNETAKQAARVIRKAKETAAFIEKQDDMVRRKASERKARLEAARAELEALPQEVFTTGHDIHKAALDVLTGANDRMTAAGFEANRLIEKAIPPNIQDLMKNPDVGMMFIPGMTVKTTTGKAGRVAAHEIGNVLKGIKPDKLIELFGRDPDNVAFMINKLKTADKQTIWKALKEVPDVRRLAEAGTKAERLAARRINEVLDSQKTARFVDFWKTDKKAALKAYKTMSTELKDDFLKMLWRSPTARGIALELQAKNIWNAASIPKKAALAVFGAGTVVSTFTLPIFALFEPLQNYNMLRFARKAVEQAKGEYPPDISFKLNRSEKVITDLQWKIKDAMKRKQFDLAADYVAQLRHAQDEYIAFREKKRDAMHPEDYTNTEALVGSTELFIADMLKQLRGEAPTTSEVEFAAKQKGAWVKLSGRRYSYKPFRPYRLKGGQRYSYTAGAPGYKTRSGSFWAEPWEKTTEKVDLEPGTEDPGKVKTRSTPEAEIWMGGIDTGFTTPHDFELPPGTYDFRFEAKGHKPEVRTATIWAGEEKTISVILEVEWTDRELTTGYLSIDTEPMGAHVFLNDVVQNWPTPTKVDLAPGQYTIKIRKTGYMSVQDSVTIEAGQTYKKAYDLEETVEPDVWRMHVSSEPAGGKILVDDFFTGAWTPGFVDVLAGEYVVGVQKTGFVPAEEVVDVGS